MMARAARQAVPMRAGARWNLQWNLRLRVT